MKSSSAIASLISTLFVRFTVYFYPAKIMPAAVELCSLLSPIWRRPVMLNPGICIFTCAKKPCGRRVNFMGGLSSIIVPPVTGFLAGGGSFTSSTAFIGVACAGVLLYLFLVGNARERYQENSNFKSMYNEPIS